MLSGGAASARLPWQHLGAAGWYRVGATVRNWLGNEDTVVLEVKRKAGRMLVVEISGGAAVERYYAQNALQVLTTVTPPPICSDSGADAPANASSWAGLAYKWDQVPPPAA